MNERKLPIVIHGVSTVDEVPGIETALSDISVRCAPNLKALLQRIYVLYSDFVMKNPFHQLDMPIRSELFDLHLDALIARHAASR